MDPYAGIHAHARTRAPVRPHSHAQARRRRTPPFSRHTFAPALRAHNGDSSTATTILVTSVILESHQLFIHFTAGVGAAAAPPPPQLLPFLVPDSRPASASHRQQASGTSRWQYQQQVRPASCSVDASSAAAAGSSGMTHHDGGNARAAWRRQRRGAVPEQHLSNAEGLSKAGQSRLG